MRCTTLRSLLYAHRAYVRIKESNLVQLAIANCFAVFLISTPKYSFPHYRLFSLFRTQCPTCSPPMH